MSRKKGAIKVVSNNDVLVEGQEALTLRHKERELLAQKLSHPGSLVEPEVQDEPLCMMSVHPLWDGKEVPKLDPAERPLWDLDLLKVLHLWSFYGVRGEGVTVTVLDSGINSLHPAFAGKEIHMRCFLSGVDDPRDYTGHGTWVAGKIAGAGVGLAPRARLKCGRVLDNSGVGNAIFTNQALAAALEDDTDIINLSLGSTQRNKEQEKLVWKLYRQGVLVVAAAGNRGSSEPLFPGAFDGVLTVGALDHKEARASFSNYGAALEIVAPGVACYGPYLGTSFRKLQGTSMAAPVVTGIMALALSYLKAIKPEMSKIDRRNKVMEALKISAKDLGPAGWDQEYGFGGLDAVALFRNLEN